MNRFKLAEKLGFDPPFDFEDNQKRSGQYTSAIDFKKLFAFLIEGTQNELTTTLFDYENFQTRVSINLDFFLNPDEDILTFGDEGLLIEIPYNIEDDSNNSIRLQPGTTLNKCIDTVHTFPDFRIIVDLYNQETYYQLAFPYTKNLNKKRVRLIDYAIVMRFDLYHQLEGVLQLLNINGFDQNIIRDLIQSSFNAAFNGAKGQPNQLDWLYAQAPDYVIINRGEDILLEDLSQLLKVYVDEIGVNEERVVIRILQALAAIYFRDAENTDFINTQADALLNTLITRRVKKQTLFARLYDKMNDSDFGEDNFTKLMQFLYNIWLFSSWAKQENYDNDNTTGPESIAYTNTKILGFNNNEFAFKFKDDKTGFFIETTRRQRVGGSIKDGTGGFAITKTLYHPFQPLRMPEIPENGEFTINSDLIPAFYLKAFDDKGVWDNFQKGVWLAIDILTIATGVGNILKFRRLFQLAKAGGQQLSKLAVFKIGVSGAEITSGTLSAMLTLTDSCKPATVTGEKSICQHMHEYLFILDLASLSTDAVISSLLKKKARDILKIADETFDQDILRHLSEIADGKGSSARFARKVSRSLDDAPKEILLFEEAFKLKKVEWGKALNKNTRLEVTHTSRLPDRINWPDRILIKIRQAIVTHNHPGGSGLSIADIEFFLSNRLNEIRAVTPDGGVFSLKNVSLKTLEKNDILVKIEKLKVKFNLARTISVIDTKVTNQREFQEVFDLIKDKVTYTHYID